MTLIKHKWTEITLDSCCIFQRGVVFSKKQEVRQGGIPILRSHNIDFQSNRVIFNNLKHISCKVSLKPEQRLKSGDILISVSNSKELTGKIGFSFSDSDCFAGGFMAIIRAQKDIHPYFLFLSLLTDRSREYIAGRVQGTTNIFNITFGRIKHLPLLRPSPGEQEQIVSLFQSIENAIDAIDAQERRLIELEHHITTAISKEIPDFGNLFVNGDYQKIRLGTVAENINKTDKKRIDISRYIGLEHIVPEEIHISSWGDIAEGITFTKRFAAGDTLFGKRRAYLKKIATVDFEGVCSSDILVLRAKSEILPELLPYYIASERFIAFAIETSSGSLSPRTKWKDLKKFEICLPNNNTQQKILDVLQQIYKTRLILKKHANDLNLLKKKLLNDILG